MKFSVLLFYLNNLSFLSLFYFIQIKEILLFLIVLRRTGSIGEKYICKNIFTS